MGRDLKTISWGLTWLLVLVIAFDIQAQQPAIPTIVQHRGSALERALDIYSVTTDRTILRSGILPTLAELDWTALPKEPNARATFIEGKLREIGLMVIPDGRAFALVVPRDWTNSLAAKFISTLKQPSSENPAIAATVISWPAATLDYCVSVYETYRGRIVLRPNSAVAGTTVQLQNQQALSRNEVEYAMTVMLALNGFAAVDDGEKLVQLVPMAMLSQVVTNAPKPIANAPRLDLKTIPKIRPIVPGFEDYPVSTPGTPNPLGRLVEYYAELTDQTFIPPAGFDGKRPIVFELEKPLTKEELIYVVKTVLRLNGWAVEAAGEKKFTLALLFPRASLNRTKEKQ